MSLPEKLVAAARTWKGTRFQHQGRLKQVGVDCVGFIAEVAREAGIQVRIPSDYKPHEDGNLMLALLEHHMELVDSMRPGDVIALSDEALKDLNVPRHLAFVSEIRPRTTLIVHASQFGVREHRMDGHWLKRIHSIWRLKA